MSNPLPRLLIIETSDRIGQVALAEGPKIGDLHTLAETRRHGRDLAPAVAAMLDNCRWRPRDVDAVIVSRGPGSYTGLRVGIMSAKTFAYATGCRLLGIDTFHAIAIQAPHSLDRVDVLADAQQDKVYVQPYARQGDEWVPTAPLAILPIATWLATRHPNTAITGPGVEKLPDGVPLNAVRVAPTSRLPTPSSILCLGLGRLAQGEADDLLSLEPLYLRPSSAEEQWRVRHNNV